MNLFRTIGAWIFWVLGELAFRAMCLIPSSERWTGSWYLVYNFFMLLSASVQRYAPGPWEDPREK